MRIFIVFIITAMSVLSFADSKTTGALTFPEVQATLIGPEISAMLINPDFHTALSKFILSEAARGYEVRIERFDVTVAELTSVGAVLASREMASNYENAWTLSGAILASVEKSPQGPLVADNIIFVGREILPGGASVGNH